MARTKWSLLKAAHVSPDPSTKYGEEVEEGTPRWFTLEITWLFFLRRMMGKLSLYVQSSSVGGLIWLGRGWGVLFEKVGLMMDSPGIVAGKSNMNWRKTQAATREGRVGEPGRQRLSHSFS